MANTHRKDCPKCQGFGAYYVTNSDHEPPIQCDCDEYTDEEWKVINGDH